MKDPSIPQLPLTRKYVVPHELVDDVSLGSHMDNPIKTAPRISRLSTRDKCNKYFARLSYSLRQKLYELYRDDFLLFGYECNPDSESNACEGVK